MVVVLKLPRLRKVNVYQKKDVLKEKRMKGGRTDVGEEKEDG